MRIYRVYLENFGKFDRYEWSVDRNKVIVVCGSNGSGKSTAFVESILWCLYGQGYKKQSADMVIRDGAKECVVRIESDKGVIERKKERGKGDRVYIDGKLAGDKDVEGLIKMGRDILLNSVIFGNALTGFVFLGEGDRREILSQLVYRDVDTVVGALNEQKRLFEKEYANLSTEYTADKVEFEKKKRLLENLVDTVKQGNVEGDMEGLEREIKGYQEQIEAKKTKLKRMREKKEALMEERKEWKNAELTVKQGIAECKGQLKEWEERTENLMNASICPMCLREIDEHDREDVVKKRDKIVADIEEKLSKYRKQEEEVMKVLKEIEEKIDEYVSRISDMEDEIERCERELKRLLVEREKIQQNLRQFDRLQGEIDALEKQIQELEDRLDRKEGRLRDLDMKKDACNFWVRNLLDYKVGVFEKVLEIFNDVASRFLLNLSNGRFLVDMGVEVSGKKKFTERIGIKILDNGKEADFGRLSNGERRLVTTALNLALNYSLSKVFAEDWNILVLDEALDGLDDGNVGKLMELLGDVAEELKKCVIVITPRVIEMVNGCKVLNF